MKNAEVAYSDSKKYRDLLNALHESIRKESDYENDENTIAASNAGLITWVTIKKLMKHVGVHSVYELEYETTYDLLYWADAFATNLHNASRQDATFLQKKFLFCQEYVEMHKNFLAKNVRNLGNIRRYFAERYVDLGDFETVDNLYDDWISKESDWGWGWIGWSDVYWLFLGKNKPNLLKALQILESGLAIKEVQDKEDLIDRYNELKKKINGELPIFSR